MNRIAQGMALLAGTLATGLATAQAYPSKPVRVIVPFSAGGATDIVARLVGQQLSELWGTTLVIDNRAGAGGNIGGDLAAKAAPDGYTLFMTSGSIVTANQHIYKKMAFDPARDLAPVTNVASGPQLVVANPSFAAKSIGDLIAMAKSKPGQISFASAGFGTQTHLAAENFLYTAKIDVVHVPYKGEAPAISDVMGGQVPFATPNMAAAIGFVKQGKLRTLGVTAKSRVPQLPDVPAVAETLPGFENLGWFGFMVPAKTPRAVIDKVHQDTVKALGSAAIRSRLDTLGMAPVGNTPEAFGKAIQEESARWANVVRERKLKIE